MQRTRIDCLPIQKAERRLNDYQTKVHGESYGGLILDRRDNSVFNRKSRWMDITFIRTRFPKVRIHFSRLIIISKAKGKHDGEYRRSPQARPWLLSRLPVRFGDMDLHRPVPNRTDFQLTEKYLIRDNRPRYTPRLVTKKPEYRKKMLGSCSKCPEKIQAECRDRIRHRPNMPVMCEVHDQLDCLMLGIEPSEILGNG